jgi:DNA polymerase III epsilon subunit-like protein
VNYNNYLVFDLETGSKNKNKTQITQISAIVLNPQTLEMIPGGKFDTEVNPIWDEGECAKLDIDVPEVEALQVTHKTREQLEKAPRIEQVWPTFVEFVKRHAKNKGGAWDSVVPVGFNIVNFDMPIITRMCQQFGPYDEKWGTQALFHPVFHVDIMQKLWLWFEREKAIRSVSLDTLRQYFGMPLDGAHNSLVDVIDTWELFKRLVKLDRHHYPKVQFEGALADWKRTNL